MAPTQLPCPSIACEYVTVEAEFEDAMRLLQMHKEMDHATLAPPPQGKKPEKFPRPTIDVDTTAEAWDDFYMAWLQYKDEYNLVGQAITRQLYACCTTELAMSLSRTTGGAHFTLSEAQLVEHMKGLAVRYQNPAVHVQEFLGLSQQHDEGYAITFPDSRGWHPDVTLRSSAAAVSLTLLPRPSQGSSSSLGYLTRTSSRTSSARAT